MATLKDVAKLAHCDISTVSRALNNSAPVHPETRARIMAAVKELGYKPMLYASDEEFSKKYDMSRLSDCDVWYCEYADEPHFPYRFSMWQYSKTATVDGIEGNADLDLCFTNMADY